ncbi:MAG: phosphoribosyl-AMP cyclohydrolase, partial [Alphaproteobacteria bacterium]
MTSDIKNAADWQKGDGLLPAVVQNPDNGAVLMLGYMNEDALAKTLETGKVTFFSRSKHRLWTKGESSGNVLHYVDVSLDCDCDTLLVTARPEGPTCHNGTITCFNDDNPAPVLFLNDLADIINQRKSDMPE